MKRVERIELERHVARLRGENRQLQGDNKFLLREIEKQEGRFSALLEIRKHTNTHIIKPSSHGSDNEGTVVWLASDWHIEEIVRPESVNNLNEFNLEIATQRAHRFFERGVRLTEIFGRDIKINTIILALLGDFITNTLHESTELALPPVEAILFVQELLASGIEYVLDNTKCDLVIPCHSGNHGRTTKYVHFGSETGHSLEYMMYCALASRFIKNKRVKFIIPSGSHSYVQVYDKTIRFLHGTEIRYQGGVGGITIPVRKAIAQWNRGRFADITCFGHFHTALDGNSFVANGSLIGYNAYALSVCKAEYERPAQQLFVLDRRRGKTVVAPILFE